MLETFLFVSLMVGQLGRITIFPSLAFYLHDVVFILYAAVFLIQYMRHTEKRKKSVLGIPFLLVAVVCILSILINSPRFSAQEIVVGALYAFRYIVYFVLYIIVRKDKHTSDYWFMWLFLLGICFSLLGYVQLNVYPDLRNLSYDGWDPHYYRLFSTLFDPNFMGALLVLSFVSGVSVMKRAKQKYWSIGGLAIIFVAFIFTFSRSSYVSAIIGMIIYIILSRKWKYVFILVFLCASMLLVPSIGGESTELFRQISAIARVVNWQEGIQVFLKSPIFGHGFNMIGALPHNAPTLVEGTVAHSSSGYDNSVIFILVTTGIIGFLTFCNLGRGMLGIGKKVLETKRHELGLLYIVLCVALLVHSMFVNTLFYPQLMLCFWIFTGAVEKEIKTR